VPGALRVTRLHPLPVLMAAGFSLTSAAAAWAVPPAIAGGEAPPVHSLVAQLEGDFTDLPEQDDPRFGEAVAVYGDLMVVGAPGTLTGSGQYRRGAVFVYRLQAGQWQQVQRIAFGTGGDGQCGTSVALGASTLLVGCPYYEVSGAPYGRAVFYTWNEANDQFEGAVNFISDSLNSQCGYSVAFIDVDPDAGGGLPIAAVGCPNRTFDAGGGLGVNKGEVIVYRWFLGWEEATRLTREGSTVNLRYGHAVMLNYAGPASERRLQLGVGMPGEGGGDGAVRVYQMGDTVAQWNLAISYTGPDDSRFGESLHMRGGRLAIGAPERPVLNPFVTPPTNLPSGSIFIATRACATLGGCSWSQQQQLGELVAPHVPIGEVFVAQNRFGHSVRVLATDRVIGGAPLYPYPVYFGQARHYLLDDGDWVLHEEEPFFPAPAVSPLSEFGTAIGSDAQWLAVGAPGFIGDDGPTGRVFVYEWDRSDLIFKDGFELPL